MLNAISSTTTPLRIVSPVVTNAKRVSVNMLQDMEEQHLRPNQIVSALSRTLRIYIDGNLNLLRRLQSRSVPEQVEGAHSCFWIVRCSEDEVHFRRPIISLLLTRPLEYTGSESSIEQPNFGLHTYG